jgi:hypothetical protein
VFEPSQRVKVNLSGLTIKGVAFSQNVQEALGTVIQRTAAEPPTYLIELLFRLQGRQTVPESESGERSLPTRRNQEVAR